MNLVNHLISTSRIFKSDEFSEYVAFCKLKTNAPKKSFAFVYSLATGEDLEIDFKSWNLHKTNPKKFWKCLLQRIQAENRINWLDKNKSNIAQLMKASQRFTPFQNPIEFYKFLKFIKSRRPKIVLEIGRYNGGSLLAFTTVSDKKSKLISIDPLFRTSSNVSKLKKLQAVVSQLCSDDQSIHLVNQASQSTESLKQVKKILKGKKIDMIFIDGDHSHDAVLKDFEIYSKLISKNGIIAFHDIYASSNKSDFKVEVNAVWNDLSKDYDTLVFKDSLLSRMPLGIGILIKKKKLLA